MSGSTGLRSLDMLGAQKSVRLRYYTWSFTGSGLLVTVGGALGLVLRLAGVPGFAGMSVLSALLSIAYGAGLLYTGRLLAARDRRGLYLAATVVALQVGSWLTAGATEPSGLIMPLVVGLLLLSVRRELR